MKYFNVIIFLFLLSIDVWTTPLTDGMVLYFDQVATAEYDEKSPENGMRESFHENPVREFTITIIDNSHLRIVGIDRLIGQIDETIMYKYDTDNQLLTCFLSKTPVVFYIKSIEKDGMYFAKKFYAEHPRNYWTYYIMRSE